MRVIPGIIPTEGKNTKLKTSSKGKTMFGYNVLGFGAGGTAAIFTVDFLLVAGGGGGRGCSSSQVYGGGGGGGGMRKFSSSEITQGEEYTVTVGGGAAGGNCSNGPQGSNSVFSGTGLTQTAAGGGFGSGGVGGDGGAGGAGGAPRDAFRRASAQAVHGQCRDDCMGRL